MEKSAVAEHAWEHHHPIHWEETTALDHGRGQELLVKEALHIQMTTVEGLTHPDDTCGRALQPRWRTASPWLLDTCDEAEREEQSSPTFNLQ